MRRLDGKVALITGAARGQGEAEARLFVEEGARVLLGDILDGPGAEVAASIGDAAAYTRLDVRDEGDWQRAVALCEERFGHVDVLVNNAGVLDFLPLVDTPLDRYLDVIEVNELGCFLGMKTVVPSMTAAGGGSIVNISSVNGFAGYPGTMAYTASKWAIRGMTRTAAMELGPLGIRVNSIHPGPIDTEMVRPAAAEGLPTAEEQAALFAAYPLRRIGQPVEVARLALFLASDRSSYSTGSEYLIDGGMLAGPLAT